MLHTEQLLSRYAAPKRFVENYPDLGLTLQGLRWLLFHRQSNGLAASGTVIKMSQRRLLIDVEKFSAWLREQNEGKGNA